MAPWQISALFGLPFEQTEHLGTLLAGLVVCPPWVWLAVRTKQCLQVITSRSIPFSKRTIWLIKILALMVGAGNVWGVLTEIGTPWFLAMVPAGTVAFFSLREKVSEIVPSKPIQDPAVHQLAWREYWRLRDSFKRAGLGFVAAFVALILVILASARLPQFMQIGLTAVCLIALLVSIAVMSFNRLVLNHWHCPGCGCSFSGVWRSSLWLPKKCAYCGLPRAAESENRSSTS
jgi:hypothetical protein